MKKIIIFISLIFIIYIVRYNLIQQDNHKESLEIQDSSIVKTPKESIKDTLILNLSVKSGENLSKILKKYNVSDQTILKIADQDIIPFNFNNLKIDAQYQIEMTADSNIISFEYKNRHILFQDPLEFSSIENPTVMKEENKKHFTKKDVLTGKFNPEEHPEFMVLDKKYHTKNKMYLQKETINAFKKMHEDAFNDGIVLIIVSGTRNFNSQKRIWEKKYKRYKKEGMQDAEIIEKIMEWSSMPSTSRHHWGTDIDINKLENEYFTHGKGKEEYKWLSENAKKYGFHQVYTKKQSGGRETGYNEEKWHWSYMPIAKKYLNEYQEIISYEDITGFSGSYLAKDLSIIENFVLGIAD